MQAYTRIFENMDANGDGQVTLAEYIAFSRRMGDKASASQIATDFNAQTGGKPFFTVHELQGTGIVSMTVAQVEQTGDALIRQAGLSPGYDALSYQAYMASSLRFACGPLVDSCDPGIKADLFRQIAGTASGAKLSASQLSLLIATAMARSYGWSVTGFGWTAG